MHLRQQCVDDAWRDFRVRLINSIAFAISVVVSRKFSIGVFIFFREKTDHAKNQISYGLMRNFLMYIEHIFGRYENELRNIDIFTRPGHQKILIKSGKQRTTMGYRKRQNFLWDWRKKLRKIENKFPEMNARMYGIYVCIHFHRGGGYAIYPSSPHPPPSRLSCSAETFPPFLMTVLSKSYLIFGAFLPKKRQFLRYFSTKISIFEQKM